ncbi:hypothetical protein [Roseateles sp. BYS87W]
MAAGLAAWAVSHNPALWPAWAAVPATAAWGWRESRAQTRRLRWDGQAWWLREADAAPERAVVPSVLMDLDRWMLLHTAAPARWLVVSRGQAPATWGGLRATLYAAPKASKVRSAPMQP